MIVTPKWLADRFFLARRKRLNGVMYTAWSLDLPVSVEGDQSYDTTLEFLERDGAIAAANLIQFNGYADEAAVRLPGPVGRFETDAVVSLIIALGGEIED